MGYGEIVHKIRKNKDLSLRSFAKLVNMDFTTLSRIEREYSNKGKEFLNVPIATLKQICDLSEYPFRLFLEEAGYIDPITISPVQALYDQMNGAQQDEVIEFCRALLGIEDYMEKLG
jgi:Helix-turn-helix.